MSYDTIKNAALKLFSEKGFDGTTIKEIASASGLKPSSIYSHIVNKEELFIRIWNECIQNTFSSVADIQIQIENKELTDPELILHTYYTKTINHFIKNSNDYLFLKQVTFLNKNENKTLLNKVQLKDFFDDHIAFNYFSKFFAELQEIDLIINCDCKNLCCSYIGIIITYLEQHLTYNFKLSEDYIDILWNIFWKGISK